MNPPKARALPPSSPSWVLASGHGPPGTGPRGTAGHTRTANPGMPLGHTLGPRGPGGLNRKHIVASVRRWGRGRDLAP